jgi:pimeloyl-ACP methyl ester carboxylesterase
MNPEPTSRTIATQGISLALAEAGPEEGPPVVLLHGFPEPWFCWRHQIGPLAEAGLRVLAPDQRGYGRSDKPREIAAYGLDVLAGDVVGILDGMGLESSFLVGHDWGGIVAWWVALRHPDRVRKLAILNAPHPAAFRRYIATHPSQMLRSWYALYFQIPGLPEVQFGRAGGKALGRALVRSSRPGTFTEADLGRYRQAWSEPGALHGMINWYRAALRHPPAPPSDPRIRVPALILWGPRDRFLNRDLADASLALCDDGRLQWIEGATHWVQHEEPERVNRSLMDFLMNK